jgi:hypothetical protein
VFYEKENFYHSWHHCSRNLSLLLCTVFDSITQRGFSIDNAIILKKPCGIAEQAISHGFSVQ